MAAPYARMISKDGDVEHVWKALVSVPIVSIQLLYVIATPKMYTSSLRQFMMLVVSQTRFLLRNHNATSYNRI